MKHSIVTLIFASFFAVACTSKSSSPAISTGGGSGKANSTPVAGQFSGSYVSNGQTFPLNATPPASPLPIGQISNISNAPISNPHDQFWLTSEFNGKGFVLSADDSGAFRIANAYFSEVQDSGNAKDGESLDIKSSQLREKFQFLPKGASEWLASDLACDFHFESVHISAPGNGNSPGVKVVVHCTGSQAISRLDLTAYGRLQVEDEPD